MLYFVTGDMFLGNHEVVVNPINTRGVAGKGVALKLKEKYPDWFIKYKEICSNHILQPGNVWVYRTNTEYPKYIFNAVTKNHWKEPSFKIYVIKCYEKLFNLITIYNIKNIGIPPLGCGCGGLYWGDLKPNVINILDRECNCNIYHYLPLRKNYDYYSS